MAHGALRVSCHHHRGHYDRHHPPPPPATAAPTATAAWSGLQVCEIVGKTLAAFDEDNLIPVFGFGDTTTTDRTVFPFFPDRHARGFMEVLSR